MAELKVGDAVLDFETVHVPAYVMKHFQPIEESKWKNMDNNTKAKYGKERFLELPGAVAATAALIREWLEEHGLKTGKGDWLQVNVERDLAPRYINLAYTPRCIDAFRTGPTGELLGCELKVSGKDGVCGLTVNEERLLKGDLIYIFSVNPVRGLIAEMDPKILLSVPRRLDGIPVSEAQVRWIEAPAGLERN